MTTRNENVRAVLNDAARRLVDAVGMEVGGAARVEALALMREATGAADNANVIAEEGRTLGDAERERFCAMLARRLRGEPVAYILGRREFYGRDFLTDGSVLIPRPETELLVELALSRRVSPAVAAGEGGEGVRVLDLGCGSGAVGLSIFLEAGRVEGAECEVVLTDASPDALATARRNAARLGAGEGNGLHFRLGDFYGAVAGEGWGFGLIVCNPPYVASGDACLTRGDLRFEPRLALESGSDGFSALRVVIGGAMNFLTAGGRLLVEHGATQGAECRRLALAAGFAEVETVRDLAGLERATTGIA